MIKILFLKSLVLILLVLTFCACSKRTQKAAVSGRFEGTGEGLIGQIKVSVVIEKNRIKSVEVLEYSDTPGYSDSVFEILPKKIADNGLDGADTVSGASITSRGLLSAVHDAVKKAGLTVKDLR